MSQPLPRPRVLIVDDLPQITHPLAVLLRHDGYHVTLADRVQTLAEVRDLAPDLIIHDLLFGRSQVASLAFVRELRGDPGLAGTPVLLCTLSHHSVMDTAMADELRALRVFLVLKPFPLATLLSTLAEACAAANLQTPRAGAVMGSLATSAAP